MERIKEMMEGLEELGRQEEQARQAEEKSNERGWRPSCRCRRTARRQGWAAPCRPPLPPVRQPAGTQRRQAPVHRQILRMCCHATTYLAPRLSAI